MTRDPYGATVRRLFAEPAHAGLVEDGTVVREDAQGVRIELSARARDGRLDDVRFRAWGCPHLIAAAEAFCAGYEGKDARDLEVFSAAQIRELLDIPLEKTGRILVLEDAVRSLGRALATARNEV